MKVYQRSVVELPFNLPEGVKNHPAIVISTNDVITYDSLFIAVMITHDKTEDDYTFHLSQNMFIGNSPPTSYQARVHLVGLFTFKEILPNSHHNIMMKESDFKRLLNRIVQVTFGQEI